MGGGAGTPEFCCCWASSSECRLTTLVSITVWVLVLTGFGLVWGKVKTKSKRSPRLPSCSIASPRPWYTASDAAAEGNSLQTLMLTASLEALLCESFSPIAANLSQWRSAALPGMVSEVDMRAV